MSIRSRIGTFTVAIIVGAVFSICASTPGGAGFLLLEEPVNARLVGMGSVGTALGGSGFSYYNPVKPFFNDGSYLSVEYGVQDIDMNRGLVESAWLFPRWFIGANFRSYSTPFTYSTEQGVNYDVPAAYQLSNASITLGYIINDKIAISIGGSGIEDRIGTFRAHALTLSAGAGYKIIPDKLTFGIAGFNQGRSTGYIDSVSHWKSGGLPRNARAGFGWCDTIKSVMPYTASIDIVYRDEDERFMVPVGLEIAPLQYLSIRMGKDFYRDKNVFNCGFGVNWNNFSVDASFVVTKMHTDYEINPLFGLTYSVGPKKAQKTVKVQQMEPQKIAPSATPNDNDKMGESDKSPVAVEPAEPVPSVGKTGTPDAVKITSDGVVTAEPAQAVQPAVINGENEKKIENEKKGDESSVPPDSSINTDVDLKK